MTDDETKRPPHKWVADKIGFSIPGVSLLRSGLRQPSMATMEEVEKALGWSMHDQIDARHDYAPELEKVLTQRYAAELEQTAERVLSPDQTVTLDEMLNKEGE